MFLERVTAQLDNMSEAADILDSVCRLVFQVVLAPDSDAEEIWEKEYAIIHYSHEKYVFKEALIRRKALASNIEFKCLHDVEKYQQQSRTASVLAAAWKQICELIEQLLYESNIDNQWQVEEIKNMCSALIKRGRFDQEDWELRKKILNDIIGHEYGGRVIRTGFSLLV